SARSPRPQTPPGKAPRWPASPICSCVPSVTPNLVVVSRTVETLPLRPLTDEAGDFYGPEEGEVNEKNLVARTLAPTRRAKEVATELRKIIAARSISAAAGGRLHDEASRLTCITPMRDLRVTGREETDGDAGARRFDS